MAQTQTARNADFSAMIKEYMPYELMIEETIRRMWLLNNTEIDKSYKGGTLYVPFEGARESSIQYGQYAAATDISEVKPVKGTVPGYKELWGSMIFNDSDLSEHDSLERSFLKLVPNRLERFVMAMKEEVSRGILIGAHKAKATAVATADDGVLTVDRPHYFQIGEKIEVDATSLETGVYVRSIDMAAKTITCYDARTGGAVIDWSANNVSLNDMVYLPGGANSDNQFDSMRASLLSQTNGGSAELYGVNKLLYPYLQAQQISGSSITGPSDILEVIFDGFIETKTVGKGNPTQCVMSYKNLGTIMKALEVNRQYKTLDSRANVYGWTEIDIVGPVGMLTVVAVNEMDDDLMFFLDKGSWKLFTNGMFKRRRDPDGKEYFTLRNADGYQYIIDTKFFGQFVFHAPSHNGVVHSISY